MNSQHQQRERESSLDRYVRLEQPKAHEDAAIQDHEVRGAIAAAAADAPCCRSAL